MLLSDARTRPKRNYRIDGVQYIVPVRWWLAIVVYCKIQYCTLLATLFTFAFPKNGEDRLFLACSIE